MTRTVALMTDEECRPHPGIEAGFGALESTAGRLPLAAMDVEARITGLYADVSIRQTFTNSHDRPLEATYVFPLPDRAAVAKFRFTAGGRVIDGVLMERGQARQTYDDAVEQGHRAAIAEEDRPGVFTMRVGNLMPRETAVVELELTGPLAFSDGEAAFRFPLVVAPRYIPGTPLPGPSAGDGTWPDTDVVPDASRITPPTLLPGFPSPVRLGLSALVDPAGLPVSAIRSSLHAVIEDSVDPSGRLRRITVRPGERLDRDFILRLAVPASAVQACAAARLVAGEAEGTVAVTLVPPPRPAGAVSRDVVFVLDRSGSMSGWKIVAARRATGRMIDSLTARDRFSVIAFDDSVEGLWGRGRPELVDATDRQRFAALEFLSSIQDRGGTEMSPALKAATVVLGARQEGRERILVLVTDGQVGNEDQLLRQVRDQARGVRVFTVGIDRAVNAAFLRRLAEPSGGVCELIETEERLDGVMANIHRRITAPVLTGVTLTGKNVQLLPGSLTPSRVADVFEGVPATLMARLAGGIEGSILVEARLSDGSPYKVELPLVPTGADALPRAWARSLIRDLEDRYVSEGNRDAALADRIVRTSLQYGVLSRFTAFVAVDRAEKVNPGGRGHRVIQPVESPEGWDMLAKSAMACAPAGAPRMFQALAKPAVSRKRKQAASPAPMLEELSAECCDFDLASSAEPAGPGILGRVTDALGDILGYASGGGPALPEEAARLLHSARESLDRLERYQDPADVRAEIGYLVGDLEYLCDCAGRQPRLIALIEALRRLIESFRALAATDPAAVRELVAFARRLFGRILAGDPIDPVEPPAPQARKDFWK